MLERGDAHGVSLSMLKDTPRPKRRKGKRVIEEHVDLAVGERRIDERKPHRVLLFVPPPPSFRIDEVLRRHRSARPVAEPGHHLDEALQVARIQCDRKIDVGSESMYPMKDDSQTAAEYIRNASALELPKECRVI